MATWFEIWVVGDDEEHLAAVAEAALDEATRLDQLLSRFDRSSEVSRINREAFDRPTRVDPELFAILTDCECWRWATDGCFDVARTTARDPLRDPSPGADSSAIELDPQRRTVRFRDPGAQLDFGGYGKGYALDRMAAVLDQFDVRDALIHGGTSSVFFRGCDANGQAWRIGLRDPFAADAEERLLELSAAEFRLRATADPSGDLAISTSAALGPGQRASDICDPRSGSPIESQAGCVVASASASDAEALSTALLAMGRAAAPQFLRRRLNDVARIGWIDDRDGAARLTWLTLNEPVGESPVASNAAATCLAPATIPLEPRHA